MTYVMGVAPGTPYEYLAGLSVTSYVVGRVSAPAYGYLAEHLKRPLSPHADADQVLRAEAGICGEASTVAQAMYAELGIGSRRVVITYPGGGHTTVEILFADAWHWFDPTFGYFFRSPEGVVYSVSEVLQLSPTEREASKVGNDSLLWSVISRQLGASALNGLDLVDLPSLRVELESGELLYERTEPPE
jgi:hypothetical protein